MQCIACGGDNWCQLPVPNPKQSMTTSGVIIPEPMQREQCMECGLLQKSGGEFLGLGRFYEEQYAKYYERPGGQIYDGARYTAMANWMKAALGDDYKPFNILDIGCGAGWQMKACQKVFKNASIEGVEPSYANAERAREAGFTVHSERFGGGRKLSASFDLIYAHNVLQHVVDPLSFLTDIADHLSPKGRLVMILPDASEASAEMLWFDHNFSFRPGDVAKIAQRAGFKLNLWEPNPTDNNLLDKQLVVLTKEIQPRANDIFGWTAYPTKELFEKRASYLSKWQTLDGSLVRRIAGHERVFNFGASMWTWLLAGYCPDYWCNIVSCVVDNERGSCQDKQVIPTSDLTFTSGDCVVLGINPVNQAAFAKKFQDKPCHIVEWSDQILS